MTTSSANRTTADDDLCETEELPHDDSELIPSPISMEEFVAAGANVFQSDEEVDDLIAMVYESRRSGLA
jgi:hypothetical protein